jgi:plasmid maintenance system antidote protein VapI
MNMNLQSYLDSKNMTKYHLSQISGIPKTTVIDICSGKSSLQKCSAHTVQQLAKALDCTMEFIMSLDAENREYDAATGLPQSKEYLERGLPLYLQSSLENMIASWKKIDSGKTDYHWDLCWSELNADINSAEVEQEISSEQAWYLREKYLRMKRGD